MVFKKTYKTYLDYDNRKLYWDNYIKFYWEENFDGVNTDFEGKFDAFKNEFLRQLKEICLQAVHIPQSYISKNGLFGIEVYKKPKNDLNNGTKNIFLNFTK